MAQFDLALQFTLKNEGGFSDNASDRGHATNFGISTQALSDYLSRPATVEDVRNITPEQVRSIYRPRYWNQVQGDKISYQSVATALFDMAVLQGPRQAVKIMQRILKVVDDGMMGPKTVSALNAREPLGVIQALSLASARFFASIVIKDNSQEVFLDGWLVRAYQMILAFEAIGGRN